MHSIPELQDRWNNLYKTHLPSLAKAHDPVQPRWPVQLDHCFARIILDNAVGVDQPWTAVVKSPAYKNMTQTQLEDAIELGEKLATGQADLVELDERSLALRGKNSKFREKTSTEKRKSDARKIEYHDECDRDEPPRKKSKPNGTVSSYFLPSPKTESDSPTKSVRSPLTSPKKQEYSSGSLTNPITNATYPSLPPQQLIRESSLTPFRKQVLNLLCQVPRGRFTTYAAMSAHIEAMSHKTCARAVGNAMRNNPFAPVVPCHRVLAADGRIGGFGGDWGEDGKHAAVKKSMLREEGVRFDGMGKVVGKAFTGFEGDGKV
ncbi:methylated-DNA--cysteine S-methyltransferase [Myriangium duriaei CBS 260.36]|uniref:Methylated-DNA--protein-cysteine methyltransferase n=1 Tax=Myriangium duriaei CBS 260.36 TaxID=1168546 RepID=A0A9P4JAU7_9PEZI|nr:methylated-DNA--cysteine S-methyltransferase [Myriangium duriaei CBS 260.36]